MPPEWAGRPVKLMMLGAAAALHAAAPLSPRQAAQPTASKRASGANKAFEQTAPRPESVVEPPPDDDLAAAIAEAYRNNPDLAARRYELRAIDDQLGAASVHAEISGGYRFTNPGDARQATRPIADRLNSPYIHDNDIGAQIIVDQPLTTGGKASADIAAARGDIKAGRQTLRGTEGDLLVDVITAYADVRRDRQALAIRLTNERALKAMLDEIVARREAGELTRTDIAQAQTQLEAARAQRNLAEAQLEDSRSSFAALVGRDPRLLAPEPPLPLMPASMDEAFNTAEQFNPDLSAAIETERASRARISSARAERRPTVALQGAAGTTGPASPFHGYDQDKFWSGRAVVTIPLIAGGRTAASIAQALDRNSADRLRIEAARRRLVQRIIAAWNQMATARRNHGVQGEQLKAARIYYEGTVEEYRVGLRSTFDALYAQNALRETEIALLASHRDEYVAEAALLRQLGQLEVRKLLTGIELYDPAAHVRQVEARGAAPWDPLLRRIDGVAAPGQTQQAIVGPVRSVEEPRIAVLPTRSQPDALIQYSPATPLAGTSGISAEGKRK
jgi:outer membrane protein